MAGMTGTAARRRRSNWRPTGAPHPRPLPARSWAERGESDRSRSPRPASTVSLVEGSTTIELASDGPPLPRPLSPAAREKAGEFDPAADGSQPRHLIPMDLGLVERDRTASTGPPLPRPSRPLAAREKENSIPCENLSSTRLSHSRTFAPSHSRLPHSRTHALTHSRPHALTHSPRLQRHPYAVPRAQRGFRPVDDRAPGSGDRAKASREHRHTSGVSSMPGAGHASRCPVPNGT